MCRDRPPGSTAPLSSTLKAPASTLIPWRHSNSSREPLSSPYLVQKAKDGSRIRRTRHGLMHSNRVHPLTVHLTLTGKGPHNLGPWWRIGELCWTLWRLLSRLSLVAIMICLLVLIVWSVRHVHLVRSHETVVCRRRRTSGQDWSTISPRRWEWRALRNWTCSLI